MQPSGIEVWAESIRILAEGGPWFGSLADSELDLEPVRGRGFVALGRMVVNYAPGTPTEALVFANGSLLAFERRGRVLVAQRQTGGHLLTYARVAQLYGALGHLNYAVADDDGRIAVAFTHPSARATSVLLSRDAGATWIRP